MRRTRMVGPPQADTFPLPREVFELGLGQGALLVYLYLVYHKRLKHSANELSCAAVSRAVGLCEKTVRKHLRSLSGKGFVRLMDCGNGFSCELCPIWDKVREHKGAVMKQRWLTGEVFSAMFPLPNEVFQIGLKAGDLLVYIYLQYQKDMRNGQCYPSYAAIGKAVGMSRKTVQKHISALVDRDLIQAENTTVRRRNGRAYNGNLLYTVKPIKQVLKEREKELLAELKLAEAQRKWAEKVGAVSSAPADTSGKNCPAVIKKGTPETGFFPAQQAGV